MSLVIENLSKKFKGKKVLKNVSMTLEPGHVYGFLGNNGAGKTTTMRAVFNMVVPDGGTITYNGIPQNKIDYSNWFYFTEKDVVPSNLSVKKYLRDIGLLAKLSEKEYKERMAVINKYVNTNFKFNRKIRKLSSGQQKVVGCLALLLLKPDVVFLDEPTANMDVRNQDFVLDIVKRLVDDNRIVVITTHLLKELDDVLTDVIILDKGVITFNGPKPNNMTIEEVFDNFTTPEEKDKISGLSKRKQKKLAKMTKKRAKKEGISLEEEIEIEAKRKARDAEKQEFEAQINDARLEEYVNEE